MLDYKTQRSAADKCAQVQLLATCRLAYEESAKLAAEIRESFKGQINKPTPEQLEILSTFVALRDAWEGVYKFLKERTIK